MAVGAEPPRPGMAAGPRESAGLGLTVPRLVSPRTGFCFPQAVARSMGAAGGASLLCQGYVHIVDTANTDVVWETSTRAYSRR